ncbi:hypothetical protein ACHAWF_009936, partial [Thalassiosira exigua]
PVPLPPLGRAEPRISDHQDYHLPGDICDTIRRAPRTTAAGVNGDVLDAFVDLVKLGDDALNNNIRRMFDLIYRGQVPQAVRRFFSDGYLFCLYKDPRDKAKMRPLGVSAKFAMDLLPYNFVIGVPGGMNFLTKAMQLTVKRFIQGPQDRRECLSRAMIFFDFVNMFNEMSREELLTKIAEKYLEMPPLALLIYEDPGVVHFRWEDGTWRRVSVAEGLNQGCPLSGLFDALFLHEIIAPVDALLKDRSADRLARGIEGDDGHGGITHFGGWVDDLSAGVPLEDLQICCEAMESSGLLRGGRFNTLKLRILTSCDGESIIDRLREKDPALADSVANTIAKYSRRPTKHDPGETEPVELVDGHRLLGSPVGSPDFAEDFCEEVRLQRQ